MKLNEINDGKSVADLGIEYKGGEFYCRYRELTSLEGSPQKVYGNFFCYGNQLTSLKGGPREVDGNFSCSDNDLTSLEGAPQEIGLSLLCSGNNQLTSLKDIHRIIKTIGNRFIAYDCPIQSHVLGLLLIKRLKKVELDNREVEDIINAHLDGGSMRSAMDCQHALIKAGFPEYAKL